ncbi:hypothetical protein EV182_007347 [Spiromyces aspiralis]|uniref:Uncharacterized protein n=1 Tax=Spiromyces aspiralis TaxID=68401 RepID=A0ACC1HSG0_9FUNG|nr:hypothetical protein EV182_007347 [Spiromyces aspiralis]
MHLKEILEKKALCQLEEVDEVGEPLDTDELAEYDSLLIGAAADCVAEIADVLGSDFLPIFDVFLDLILGYYKPSNAVSERSTAIGCLSEITNNLDAAITKYTNVLFSLFMDGLASKDAEVRSNAAYGVGVLVEHSTEDASSHYTGILKALYPLLESSNESNQADNACGAIARLIRKNPTAVPLSQLLPVWLKYLPLKSDHQEDLVIYDTLSFLLQNYLDEVKPFREILANIFRAALSNEETLMSEEARAYITSL